MGLAQRNTYSDAGGYVPELIGKHATRSFNGIKALQIHHDHVARLKDYLYARTKVIPDVPLTCYSECLIAQCLQSERGKEIKLYRSRYFYSHAYLQNQFDSGTFSRYG
jgi:hypothetical protein